MKKAVAIYVLCGALLSGCSWVGEKKTLKADEMKNQEIVLLMPDNTAASTQYRINMFQKHSLQFEAANPGVKIKIEKLPQQSYRKAISTRLNEEKPIDLIFGPFDPTLAEEGRYADLLNFYKADRMTTNDLYEPLTEMVTTKGKLNGIPLSPTPLAVYYNKDWFDKAGSGYPGGDWTWEQYFDMSIKLKSANTAENKDIYGSTIPFELQFFESLARSSGNSILSPDNSKVSGFLDSRSVSAAFSLLVHHMNDSNASKRVDSMGNPTLSEMTSGNVGMSIAPFGMYYFLENNKATKGKIGIATLPRLEKGKRANTVTVQTLSVAAVSKQKELAWKFVKDVILNSDSPFHEDWSRQELLTSKFAVQKLKHDADPVRKVFLDELNYAVKPVTYRNVKLGSLVTQNGFGRLLTFQSDAAVQTALTEAAYQIDQQLMIPKQD